jgi:hypothetical protein
MDMLYKYLGIGTKGKRAAKEDKQSQTRRKVVNTAANHRTKVMSSVDGLIVLTSVKKHLKLIIRRTVVLFCPDIRQV